MGEYMMGTRMDADATQRGFSLQGFQS